MLCMRLCVFVILCCEVSNFDQIRVKNQRPGDYVQSSHAPTQDDESLEHLEEGLLATAAAALW